VVSCERYTRTLRYRALDELYRTFFAPYLRLFDLAWCGFGLWCAIRPAMLVGPYGALVLNRDVARTFGLSPSLAERVLSIADQREQLVYDDRIGRIGGCVCILAGLLGVLNLIDPAVCASLAVVALAWSLALYATSGQRADRNYVASLDVRHPSQVVSMWYFGPMVIAALTLIVLGTFGSIFVGVSTLVVLAAIWKGASVPGVFFGKDAVLERHIDARYRLARVATIITISPIPLQIWFVTSYAGGSGSIALGVIRLLVQAVILSEIAFMLVASWRCNRELRRIVAAS